MKLSDFSKMKNLKTDVHTLSLNFSQHKDELISIIQNDKSRKPTTDGVVYTNLFTTYRTGWYIHENYSLVKKMCELIDNIIVYKVSQVPISISTKECWGGIYHKEDYAREHHHTPYTWSWCYYVSAPEGSAPMVFPTHEEDTKGKEWQIIPKDDMLIVFPGSKVHSVPKSIIDNPRIVIAGNSSY